MPDFESLLPPNEPTAVQQFHEIRSTLLDGLLLAITVAGVEWIPARNVDELKVLIQGCQQAERATSVERLFDMEPWWPYQTILDELDDVS